MIVASQDTNGGRTVIACSILFSIITTIFVSLRLFAAYKRGRLGHVTEWCVVAALVFTLGFSTNMIVGAYIGGSGQHVTDVMMNPAEGEKTLVHALKNFWAATILWGFATAFCKLAVLTLYMELFTTNAFRKACYFMIGIVFAQWAGYELSCLLVCRPISKNWYPTEPGKCGNALAQEIAAAVVNMVVDATIALMPIPVLRKLQMPLSQKLGVGCMFGLGLIVSAMNATRVGIVATAGQADFTYTLTPVALFGGFELWFGTIVTCLPPLRTLFTDSRTYGDSPSGSDRATDHRRLPSNATSSAQSWRKYSPSDIESKHSIEDDLALSYQTSAFADVDIEHHPAYPPAAASPTSPAKGGIGVRNDVSVQYWSVDPNEKGHSQEGSGNFF